MKRSARSRATSACAAGICLLLGAVVVGAGAQVLRPLDQPDADRNPLSRDARQPREDLRSPTGFSRVYRVEGALTNNAWSYAASRRGLYARASGGIIAVFPRGTYRPVAPGLELAEVPPGTVYLLGDPGALIRQAAPPPSSVPRSDLTQLNAPLDPWSQVDFPQPRGLEEVPPSTRTNPASIWSSDLLRTRTVHALLDRARDAG